MLGGRHLAAGLLGASSMLVVSAFAGISLAEPARSSYLPDLGANRTGLTPSVGSKIFAQAQILAQAQEEYAGESPEGWETTWGGSAALIGYYDTWQKNEGVSLKGHQYAEILGLNVFGQGILMPTDTALSISYSTFDYETWGLEGSINVNLPTGESSLTERELDAVPNASLVSYFVQGAGLDIGGQLKYLRQLGNLSIYTGIGYTRRGAYDTTAEVDGDDVSGGDMYSVLGGGNYKISENIAFGFDSSYTRTQETAGVVGNEVSSSISAGINVSQWQIYMFSGVSYGDSEPQEATETDRREEFQKGLSGYGGIQLSYAFPHGVTLKGTFDGSYSGSIKPADPTFYSTDASLASGLGVDWTIPDTPITLNVLARHKRVFTESAFEEFVEFSGDSVAGGISATF